MYEKYLQTFFQSVCGLVCLESFTKKNVLKIMREKMPVSAVILCRSALCLCDIINKAWHMWYKCLLCVSLMTLIALI